jgi:hypothetical protein
MTDPDTDLESDKLVVELEGPEPEKAEEPVVAPEPEKPEPEKPLSEEPDQDEIASYSARVQARIKKMSAQTHAERRKAEALAQQVDEAARVARALYEDNQRLKNTLHQGETFLKSTDKERLEAKLAQVTAAYKTAFEAGDADGMAHSAAEIGKIGAQLERNETWQPAPPPPPPPPPQPQVQRPPPQVDQKTVDWQDRNQWFGRDDAMTGFALGVHRHVVNVEGIDPRSDDYFQRIDNEMRQRFPEKFSPARPPSPARSPVAPAARVSAKPVKRVELTPTQVALSKKLGLTPQQYAEEVLKLR